MAHSTTGRTFTFTFLSVVLRLMLGAAQAQQLVWTQKNVSGPPASTYPNMAFDSARGVTVLTLTDNQACQTWEWNGAAWAQRVVSPSPPYGGVMVYDSGRGVTVLYIGQTWEWNGTAWTRQLVSGPPISGSFLMAYDAARGVTVAFNGAVNASPAAQTWEWNGTAWTRQMVTQPPPRYWGGMAYDAGRHVTVLFGGHSPFGTNYGDTWEWDGTAWQSPSGGSEALATGYPAMAYDSTRNVSVIFGIGNANGANGLGDQTWERNGTSNNWTQRFISGPSPRRDHAMAYDSIRGKIVLFGGMAGRPVGGAANGETWILGRPCGSADFNCDGDTGTDADIEAFFACIAGACPAAPCLGTADFNGDGDVGTDADIEAFFRVLAGGSC
jgi:hypothetical protein